MQKQIESTRIFANRETVSTAMANKLFIVKSD